MGVRAAMGVHTGGVSGQSWRRVATIKPRGFSSLTAEGAAMKRLLVCLLLLGVVGCEQSDADKAISKPTKGRRQPRTPKWLVQ
jgi:hypothetical protein